jgi:cytosine/adenosine deaminase-related metal-dependent hydrolase
MACGEFEEEGVNIIQSARHDNEAHKVREWERAIRNFAGGQDGARVIEWARRYHGKVAPTMTTPYPLSGVLMAAMDRLARGDTITADLEWRTK